MSTYSLGSDDAELSRLEAQAAFLEAPTRLLLGASGLRAGMRVLDLGSGLGHVSRAVAEVVGPDGEVVGLDLDDRMVAAARERSAHHPQVSFVQADVTRWRDDAPFDAVVGRLILFHLADPAAVLRHHLEGVRPGGRAVLLDFDVGGVRTAPPVPLVSRLTELVMAAFRAAGADPVVGSRLQPILAACGVEDIGGVATSQYLGPESPVGPALLGGVVRSLAPVMVANGLATEEELDVETLPARIGDALRSAGAALVPPVLAGAWGTRP